MNSVCFLCIHAITLNSRLLKALEAKLVAIVRFKKDLLKTTAHKYFNSNKTIIIKIKASILKYVLNKKTFSVDSALLEW